MLMSEIGSGRCVLMSSSPLPDVDAHDHQVYLSEVIVWTCLRHPNIVPFVGVPDSVDSTQDVVLVSEWMGGGTISSYLRQRPNEHRGRLVSRLFSPSFLPSLAKRCKLIDGRYC
jgi:serine/threonine protein kinase